jgi:hypothetical protein
MAGDGDILELGGVKVHGPRTAPTETADARVERPARFLSVWFRCCHVYGRMHRNTEETAYEGRCPKCAAAVRARIGPEGTSQRLFEAM